MALIRLGFGSVDLAPQFFLPKPGREPQGFHLGDLQVASGTPRTFVFR